MADEVQKLILDVIGREKVEQLNGELARESAALVQLAADLRTGATTQAAFDAAARTSAEEVRRLEAEIKKLGGRGLGVSGGSILQASYAVQDFTSVLSGGQGLARALSSIQNNIPGLLMALGVSGGLAGAVSLVSVGIGALIPLAEKMWGSLDDKEAAERVKKHLKEVKDKIDEAHKAFQALEGAPTDYEKESVALMKEYLATLPNAHVLAKGLASTMGEKSARASMSKEQEDAYDADRGDILGDAEIERRATWESGTHDPTNARHAKEVARLAELEENAIWRRNRIIEAGKTQRTEQLIHDSLEHSAKGHAARVEIAKRMRDSPELFPGNLASEMADMEPGALEEFDEAHREEQEGHDTWRANQAQKRDKTNKELDLNLGKLEADNEAYRAAKGEKRAKIDKDLDLNLGKLEADNEAYRAAKEDRNKEVHGLEREYAEGSREIAAAELDQARQQVILGSRKAGHGTPTEAQADEMARRVIDATQQGIATNQAILSAVEDEARKVRGLREHSQQQQVRALVTRGSQRMGYGTPNDAQADEMAASVIGMTRQGVDTNQAILSAIEAKARQISQIRQQLQSQQARAQALGMGNDNSGFYSAMPGVY